MSERQAYLTLATNITLPGDRIDRVENFVGLGFPDTNLCFSGMESWIEIKAPTEPKRETTKLFGSNHKVSQDQMNWFLRQRKAGGRGFIYIQTDKRRMLIDGTQHADEVNEKTINELLDIALWDASIPTSKAEWMDLRDCLAPLG